MSDPKRTDPARGQNEPESDFRALVWLCLSVVAALLLGAVIASLA